MDASTLADELPSSLPFDQWSTLEMQRRGFGPFHLNYWFDGAQAGGYVFKYGNYKGSRINAVPWDFLLEELKGKKDQPVSYISFLGGSVECTERGDLPL
jgi:hypothetical protein